MLLLGERQDLVVVKQVEFGVYLAESKEMEQDRVLLPAKQVPQSCKMGDKLSVFLYKDSSDRLIATVREPKMYLHQVAKCRVVEAGNMGAFLDWGLEKDLLLPFKEQTYSVKKDDEVLAALYIDKSSRLCGTMKIYPYLSTEADYQKDAMVEGLVYEISEEFGAFVAVDDKFSALIPKKEFYGNVKAGERIQARVTAVKEDGKLDLSIREKAYIQMDQDAEKVREKLLANGGVLPFNDKASPELIREEMHMSKNEFKRAVGRLYKEKEIVILSNSIELLQK